MFYVPTSTYFLHSDHWQKGLNSRYVSFVGCGGNYHKKCAYKIPNNCSDSRHRANTQVNSTSHSNTLPRPTSQVGDQLLLQHSNSLTDSLPSKDRRATWGGRPVWIEPALSGRIQVPHTFAIHSYKKPTVCQICKRLVSCSTCCVDLNVDAGIKSMVRVSGF